MLCAIAVALKKGSEHLCKESLSCCSIYDKQLKQSQLLMIPLLIGSGVVFAQIRQVGDRLL
ncbi:hypothetical protein BCT46_21960 [Vibrio sp. 10N.261.46.E8]|nr:hypothetical protein BH584_18130 [Vibrio sp. 10N.261.45.E1]PMJ34660.1 hypothetical protein BCU27_24565 [Vibrio sp. 10N.286.45.B6]PML96375.1 hypothetical protein BCT66_22015 [Vibrio sp. 10N.261.49.E11]PMM71954.1 hypothetical protein BCT48_07675 [Vibrio sp. 10N.261.46.F12]PMM78777.1 hypothetical protein BCT46_21960 [Vibrio sp. 10N.261.46.E8]PMN37859.1 hypothetical protein BCT34_05335 [Vibrio sp. 10N.261.45.E2]PMN57897.1 hypothetical protein BCT32_01255 [Vibrio sp. 10N.261.45.E11]PMN75737.1 